MYKWDDPGTEIGIASALFFGSLIVYGTMHSLELGKFKYYFQQNVVSRIIPRIGKDFHYEARGAFPEKRIRESELFYSFNRYQSEDMVRGRVGAREIAFAEIKLEKKISVGLHKNNHGICWNLC